MDREPFTELFQAALQEKAGYFGNISLLALTAHGVKHGSVLEIIQKNSTFKACVDKVISHFGLYCEVRERECKSRWTSTGHENGDFVREYFTGPMWLIWVSQYPFKLRKAMKNAYTQGEFYGYPYCCTKASVEGRAVFGPFRNLSFSVCDPNCEKATALSMAYDAVLKEVLPVDLYQCLYDRKKHDGPKATEE